MAATMRISSQVWPIWLPRAVARAEQRIINTAASKQPIPPLLFSAAFQSHISHPESSSTQSPTTSGPLRSNNPTKSSQLSSQQQQLRTFSSRLPRPIQRTQIRQFSNSPTSPPPIPTSHDPPQTPAWTPPTNVFDRPVTIIGAGVLGRRLATLWASTSRPVTLYDTSPSALKSATSFIADSLNTFCSEQGTHPGHVRFTTDFHSAIEDAWMVIEAVPEDLELKISILGRLDRILPKETIIATNSASFRSSELVSEVRNRDRVLNTLYYIPPKNRCVELMSCGYTSPDLLPFLNSEMQEIGLQPIIVRNESTGLIFPRLFAALKREALIILQEGIAEPEEIDELFRDFFGAEKGVCEKMDEVGLDTVARTERHFLAAERGWEEDGEFEREGRVPGYLEWLEREYVQRGRLGEKSGEGLVVKRAEKVEEKKVETGAEVWNEHAVDLSGL